MTTRPLDPALEAVLARLDARINWENRKRRDAMRVDVGPSLDLLARLGDPQRAWRSVHVGGTKGKGSVAAWISAGLRAGGLRVGTYGSPHVSRVTERARIDLEEVEDAPLAAALEAALKACEAAEAAGTEAARASWFDLMTAAAFRVFAEAGVDWAVVEVGLGGRLDSTNVLAADVAVITTIDLEHTEILGDTRAKIAAEKAGILRSEQSVVTGVAPLPSAPRAEDAGAVIERRALEVGARYVRVQAAGDIEQDNRSLARAALDCLGWRGHLAADGARLRGELLNGLPTPSLPGRWERAWSDSTPVVLDGGHVASSLSRVLDVLERDAGLRGFPVAVLGLGADKDAEAVLKALHGRVDRVLCTSWASPLAASADDLERLALSVGHRASAIANPEEALAEACRRVSPGGWVLVTGSLHLVGALRSRLVQP